MPRNPDSGDPVVFHGMWTRCTAMKRVFRLVERAARSEAAVLLRGETGTGKELAAIALHRLSPRASGPFRAINCAALPATLLESELFGHVRGAFTGAVRDHPGVFRSASGGTLFLDEVAEMPLDLQAKLLRVLETRTVVPVGGRDPIRVDVRIVSATHTGLRAAVAAGRFRADLMYRLRVVPIFLPALRERPGDVALLTDRFIEELNARGGRRVRRVSPHARRLLDRYPWPGNVRELRNALEYAYVMGDGETLRPDDLPPEVAVGTPETEEIHAEPAPPGQLGASPSSEADLVRDALRRAQGSRGLAARLLGISRVTLWRRMRALGLS
ncbi:MAG: sigma 54-interacting transcriptional regulator [Myxococcales bacterium]|nr:sigma 54-interacting transcriptional regulator [Myxococcales bacterium]